MQSVLTPELKECGWTVSGLLKKSSILVQSSCRLLVLKVLFLQEAEFPQESYRHSEQGRAAVMEWEGIPHKEIDTPLVFHL